MLPIDDIISAVRRKTQEFTGVGDVWDSGLCVYVSHFLCEELLKYGVTPLLQAGTCLWKFREHASGITHVGYEWDAEHQINFQSLLPELHAWVAIRETQQLVDLTLPRFRSLATALGHVYELPLPDRLWHHVKELPPECVYRPDKMAIFSVVSRLKSAGISMPYWPSAQGVLRASRTIRAAMASRESMNLPDVYITTTECYRRIQDSMQSDVTRPTTVDTAELYGIPFEHYRSRREVIDRVRELRDLGKRVSVVLENSEAQQERH